MRSFAGLRLAAVALCTGLVFTCSTYGDEREEIKLRIQEIKKQAAQMLEEGRKDKAAVLMREQEELMGKLRRMGGEGRAEGRGPSPEEMKMRIEEIRKQASRLMEEGHKDKAAGMMREQEELMNKLRRMGGEGRAEGRGPSPEEMKMRIEEIRKQAGRLMEEGHKDKAAGLMREQEELMNILRRMGGEGRAEGRGPSPEQMEKFERAMQKVRHLRIASEHLKHAEMHDMALDLMRQAEGIEQDLRNAKDKMAEQMQGLKDQPRRDQPQRQSPEARGQEGRGLEDRLNGLQQGIEALRSENQQLRMVIEKIALGLGQHKFSENSQSNPKLPQVEGSMMAFSKRQMARLDKDKSGFLTWDEWIEDRHSFSDVDFNKDGKVDVEEYANFRNKR